MSDLRTQAAQYDAADKQHREELMLRLAPAPMKRCGTVKNSVTSTRMVEVVSGDEPANDVLAPAVWPMPAGGPIKSFRDLDAECNASARAIVRGVSPERLRQLEDARAVAGALCDECETVAHCAVHGCIPKVPLTEEQLAQGDLENHHLKVSGELERRLDLDALRLQQNYLGTGL